MNFQMFEKKLRRWISPALVVALVVGLGLLGVGLQAQISKAAPATAGTEVSGSLSEDITWTRAGSPYIVMGNTTVNSGVTLVIEPGVQVRFDGNYWLGVNGTLVAQGTAGAPIVFTSNRPDPSPGDWDEIGFGDSSVDYDPKTGAGCIMENVVVEYGGGYNLDRMVNINAASPLIKDCVFRKGVDTGVNLENGAASIIEGNTFEEFRGPGLRMSGGSNPTVRNNVFRNNGWAAYMDPGCNPKFEGNTATDNVHNGIGVGSGDTPATVTWHADLPYIPDGNVRVPQGAVLTIEAGTQVRFNCNCWLGVDGTLVAQGTSGAQIVFTSERAVPFFGDWDEIGFGDSSVDYDPNTGAGCIMENVVVEYGGGYNWDRMVNVNAASPLIKDCVFRKGVDTGVNLENGAASIIEGNTFEEFRGPGLRMSGGSNPTVRNNVFRNNGWAAYMDPGCNPKFEGNTATDNVHNGIGVGSGDTPATVTWHADLPYIPDGNVRVPQGAVLTIEAGTQVRFNCNCWLGVDGTLVAQGTSGAQIVFTSEKAVPFFGDWDEIGFGDSSVDYDPNTGVGCIMENVIVEYGGGYNWDRMVNISAASPLIKDCLFRHGTMAGISVQNGAAPILEGNTFEEIWGEGLSISDDSNPVIR